MAEDWLGKWAMNLMLLNVSMRKFRRAVRLPEGDIPAPAGSGVSKSATSRHFVALSAARLRDGWRTGHRRQSWYWRQAAVCGQWALLASPAPSGPGPLLYLLPLLNVSCAFNEARGRGLRYHHCLPVHPKPAWT